MDKFNIDKKNILLWLGLFLLAEVASFLTFIFPYLANIFTGFLILVFIILCLKDLKWAILFILAELILGVQGHMFSINIMNLIVPLRIIIFVIWFSFWFVRAWFEYRPRLLIALVKYRRELMAIMFLLFLGLINGFLSGHKYADIFFDANGWFYWLYFISFMMFVLPWKAIWSLLITASGWIAVKTIFLEYIFSHQFETMQWWLYHWLRDYRMIEITPVLEGFRRIFSQNQIFLIIPILAIFFYLIQKKTNHKQFAWLGYLVILGSAFFISMSRSFWLGIFVSVLIFVFIFLFKNYFNNFNISIKKSTAVMLIVLFSSLALVWVNVNFPIPDRVSTELTQLLSTRFGFGDAASSARLKMLGPLSYAIGEKWFLGHGFGKTIDYFSTDPRIVQSTAGRSGHYTTYAFEWGYLDIWLKLGLLGGLIYFIILLRFIIAIWKKAVRHRDIFLVSATIALTSLCVLNITTPYLNHPLGIGYILLILLLVNSYLNYGLPTPQTE